MVQRLTSTRARMRARTENNPQTVHNPALRHFGWSNEVPRETMNEKAIRYLAEGRVRLLRVEADALDATVEGARPRPYVVTHRAGPGWRCTCIAVSVRCSHMVAVSMVTLAPEPPDDKS